MTTATGTCANCGTSAQLAEVAVYRPRSGDRRALSDVREHRHGARHDPRRHLRRPARLDRARARSAGVTRRQRLTLLAAILGSGIATIDGTIVNVALPAIEDDLGGGLQAQQWVVERLPADARLADPDRRLARRHLRRAARVRARRRRVRRALGRVRGGADDRGADRGARAPGRGRRAADAELARDHRRRVRADASAARRSASWTAWGGIAAIVGPLAGGVIVDQASWRWIFAINVPVVARDARARRSPPCRRRLASTRSARRLPRRRRSARSGSAGSSSR